MEANGNSTVFMQGNVPYHVAKSPDINPIENDWRVLKQKVYERQNLTKKILTQHIREEGNALNLVFRVYHTELKA